MRCTASVMFEETQKNRYERLNEMMLDASMEDRLELSKKMKEFQQLDIFLILWL